MHHGKYLRTSRLGWTTEEVSVFNDTRAGVLAWCSYIDGIFMDDSNSTMLPLSESKWKQLSQVPCKSDFFRYVQWHNLAIEMIAKRSLQSLTIYYEDYRFRHETTVNRIFSFVNLRAVNEPLPFKDGQTYQRLFAPEERLAARDFMRALSSNETWSLLHRYFDTVEAS
jgi:hypothetical protein